MNKLFCVVTALIAFALACSLSPSIPASPTNPPPAAPSTNPPTSIPPPTATTSPTATPAGAAYAWNYLAEIESGGVSIQIARLILAEKKAIPDIDFSVDPALDDKSVVIELIFIVKNTTSETLNVYPDQGTVVAGAEQVELLDYFNSFGDRVGGEILPGVTKIGGLWFGFRRTPIEEIQRITLIIRGPHDQNLSSRGPEYSFDVDLSQRRYETLPAELR